MNSPCPHCQQPHGVNWLRVAWSGRVWAAECKACGRRFYVESFAGWLISEVLFLPLGIAAFALKPVWLAFLAALAAALFVSVIVAYMVRLVPAP